MFQKYYVKVQEHKYKDTSRKDFNPLWHKWKKNRRPDNLQSRSLSSSRKLRAELYLEPHFGVLWTNFYCQPVNWKVTFFPLLLGVLHSIYVRRVSFFACFLHCTLNDSKLVYGSFRQSNMHHLIYAPTKSLRTLSNVLF